MSAMILFITASIIFLLHLIYIQIGLYYKIHPKKQNQSRTNKIVTGAGINLPIS
jgi:hypothetical protein